MFNRIGKKLLNIKNFPQLIVPSRKVNALKSKFSKTENELDFSMMFPTTALNARCRV